MKTAKIYFEGNLVSEIEFETVMYVLGHEFRDKENQLVAIVPLTHLIVVKEIANVVRVNGEELWQKYSIDKIQKENL